MISGKNIFCAGFPRGWASGKQGFNFFTPFFSRRHRFLKGWALGKRVGPGLIFPTLIGAKDWGGQQKGLDPLFWLFPSLWGGAKTITGGHLFGVGPTRGFFGVFCFPPFGCGTHILPPGETLERETPPLGRAPRVTQVWGGSPKPS